MLKGSRISLRPATEADLEEFQRARTDIETRGAWVPVPRTPFQRLHADFEQTGWWSEDEGVFFAVDESDRLRGYVSWGRLNGSIPDVEVTYGVFDRSAFGRGIATEAVGLLVGYLFEAYSMNRLIAYVHPENVASQRVVEKNGFVREATLREAWPRRGMWHDIHVYALTRAAAAGSGA